MITSPEFSVMNDLERLVETARGQSQIDWDVERSRAAHAHAVVRHGRRRMGKVLLGAAAVGALLALVADRQPRLIAPSPRPPAREQEIALVDGSRATIFGGAELRVREHGPDDRILVDVPRGRVRFAVRS